MIESVVYLKVTISSAPPATTPAELENEAGEALDRLKYLVGWDSVKVEAINHMDPRA